jgi:DNA-binding transcriptional ArsR family regulator
MGEGFTMIPNEMLEALTRASSMKAAELRVVLHLIRQSLGYNRQGSGEFGSIGAISKATEHDRRTVTRALASLKESGIVTAVSVGVEGSRTVYRVNPPESWGRGAQTPRGVQTTRGAQTPTGRGAQTPTPRGVETPTQKTKEKTKKRQDPPYPPSDSKRWTAGRLYVHLGGRGTIPPLQQPKWCAIGERSDEDLDAAIGKVMDFERPLNRFVELFDLDGADVVPGWERKRQEREAEERKANNGRPPGETDEERWARLAREYGT